jgi:uncharacterized protein with von Willebrand factor type A (vWA) domain
MKNLMIAAVLSLGTMTAFAQQDENAVEEAGTEVEETATDASNAIEESATETYDAAEETATEATDAVEESATETYDAAEETATEATDAAQESATEATDAVEETAADASESMSQDSFNEVSIEEVPESITSALEEAHPGATVDKASMNDQDQYKLEVTKEDGETAELYMDAEGNEIEM